MKKAIGSKWEWDHHLCRLGGTGAETSSPRWSLMPTPYSLEKRADILQRGLRHIKIWKVTFNRKKRRTNRNTEFAIVVIEMYCSGDHALCTNQCRSFTFNHFLICNTQLLYKIFQICKLWNEQYIGCTYSKFQKISYVHLQLGKACKTQPAWWCLITKKV